MVRCLKSYCLLLLTIPLDLLPQSGDTIPELAADSLNTPPESSLHSIYTGIGYGTNMIYLGSNISGNHPYGYASLAYGLGSDLLISASAFYLSYDDPLPGFCTYALNYNHVFNSWLDIAAGAYRYQVRPSLTETLFSSFSYGEAAIGLDWRLLYTQISYGGFLLKEPQTFLQVRNSRYFHTSSFFGGKAEISFNPWINLLFGTMITAETYYGTTLVTTTQSYVSPIGSDSGNTGGTSGGYGTGTGQGTGQGSGSDPGSQQTTTATTTSTVPTTSVVYTERFDLIEVACGLPVAFNTTFMTIEAEPGYVFSAYDNESEPGPTGFTFTVSAFFRIFGK